MGYSLSWAAIKGADPHLVHEIMGVRPSGKPEEIPESDIVGAQLPNGWYLLLYNKAPIKDRDLKRLSFLGEVVYCFVEDHVMFSSACGLLAGVTNWSVTHDCEKGRFHLQVEGQAPPSLTSIQQRLTAEQNAAGGEKSDTDYIYEIPAELARELTGFRHDQSIPDATAEMFQVLERVRKKKWKLFG